MEKLNKLSLPVTILMASMILGVAYYITEISKQDSIRSSIERQQRLKVQQEKDMQYDLKNCLATASADYFNFLRLNGPDKNIDGRMTDSSAVIEIATNDKRSAEDSCYKVYK